MANVYSSFLCAKHFTMVVGKLRAQRTWYKGEKVVKFNICYNMFKKNYFLGLEIVMNTSNSALSLLFL